ncbi:hypothetical protein B0T19DRAFT_489064 [Cercophora scortea]|uniref:Uncharacterized protein n=1 Tax=Cercophora scortea TaxID=314031 RepID=A0AAE0I3W5_9PEZI|nr:hypothetical protein B0T19DRAFT_489064 [Cercophora scortea]
MLSPPQLVNATSPGRRGAACPRRTYACIVFPREQWPDIGAYMQGTPDTTTYMHTKCANDILSPRNGTLAGKTDDYTNTRAVCEPRDPVSMLETVVAEMIAANSRVRNEFFDGYIFLHFRAQRYKLHLNRISLFRRQWLE